MTRSKRSISSPRDFRDVYRRGKRASSPHFFIYLRATSGTNTRFAIVVPNHVIQGAVKRNLVRRRIRSILSSNEDDLSGIECIISVRLDPSHTLFSTIKGELEKTIATAAGRTL